MDVVSHEQAPAERHTLRGGGAQLADRTRTCTEPRSISFIAVGRMLCPLLERGGQIVRNGRLDQPWFPDHRRGGASCPPDPLTDRRKARREIIERLRRGVASWLCSRPVNLLVIKEPVHEGVQHLAEFGWHISSRVCPPVRHRAQSLPLRTAVSVVSPDPE